jgi:hypothetical protein
MIKQSLIGLLTPSSHNLANTEHSLYELVDNRWGARSSTGSRSKANWSGAAAGGRGLSLGTNRGALSACHTGRLTVSSVLELVSCRPRWLRLDAPLF